MRSVILVSILVCCISFKSVAMKLPGPSVYVVTPSSIPQMDEGRSAPFYYHNWMRRIDSPHNETSSTTSSTPTTTTSHKTKSPDLIFAQFESGHMKNIRKLLERERITSKTTTMTSTPSSPIYMVDEPMESQKVNYGLPSTTKEAEENNSVTKDKTDYFAFYNNLYDNSENLLAPVFVPSAATPAVTTLRSTTTSTTAEKPTANNVENIWHIIDSERHGQYEGQWDEVLSSEDEHDSNDGEDEETTKEKSNNDNHSPKLDENFALPGFSTNSGNDAENESRAIRTEPNIRFPYVNLKPFKMKNLKKPLLNTLANSKKNNYMYTSLDNFFEIKNPVRGEVEEKDTLRQPQQPIDRYNPAQPYLPSPEYGSKSKQSSPTSFPVKTVANLVPPPPPPAPQLTADDFPAPVSYESFPPYAQSGPAPAPSKTISRPQPPDLTDDSNMPPTNPSEDEDVPLGYQYRPPPPSSQPFLPTVSPLKPSYGGFSYNKPSMTIDSQPVLDNKPDFQGYNYDKPTMPEKPFKQSYGGYSYIKPSMTISSQPGMDNKPDFEGYSYDKPAPAMPEKPFNGYQYSKPELSSPPMDHPPPSYGSHRSPAYDSDYPELIFDKPHGSSNEIKGGDDSMGMMPPPAPSRDVKPDLDLHGPPGDDSGFPHDFPSDFKFPHDFDNDHDHDYYHHHHTTTTTTTTETPRVNRYSYYYLGKKLYYLPLYFSVYFIIYVGALIIKAVLRHKIVYPNSYRPNDDTATYFTKRSVDSWNFSNEYLHEITGRVTHAIAAAAEKYMNNKRLKED